MIRIEKHNGIWYCVIGKVRYKRKLNAKTREKAYCEAKIKYAKFAD